MSWQVSNNKAAPVYPISLPPSDIFSMFGHTDEPRDPAMEAAELAACILLRQHCKNCVDGECSIGVVPACSLLIACHLLKVKHSAMTPRAV